MKAYVLEEIGSLVFKEIDKPQLKQNEVLVEVKAAGICGSDIPRIYETGTYHFPLIPGHEFSGTVVEVADRKNEKWLSQNVGVFPLIPCRNCSSCLKEEYEMCLSYNYLGSRCNGGFAEYVAVPVWNLIGLPKQMDFKEAAMLEPAAVALHAIRKLVLQEESSVVLFGLGTIGVIITQWLSYYKIQKVIATGHQTEFGDVMKQISNKDYQYRNAQDIETAKWIKSQTNDQGVDIVIDCVGTSQSLSDCLESVKPGGQILIVGNPKGDIHLSQKVYWQILRKQVTLRGTWNSSFLHKEDDDWNTVIKACCDHKLQLSALITHQLPFESLEEGLRVMKEKQVYRNKVMICHKYS